MHQPVTYTGEQNSGTVKSGRNVRHQKPQIPTSPTHIFYPYLSQDRMTGESTSSKGLIPLFPPKKAKMLFIYVR